jgi:DNA-binding PadR family transcriptional regulator
VPDFGDRFEAIERSTWGLYPQRMPEPIKLTVPSYIVLGIVKAVGKATPYEMKQFAARSLDHFWSVRHAQLYSEPERLTQAGYLTEQRESGGRRRKTYTLTKEGERAYDKWISHPSGSLPEIRDEAMLKIFFDADAPSAARESIPQHEERLAIFQEAYERLDPHLTEGQRLVVKMGIDFENFWVAKLREVESGALTGAPPAKPDAD